MSKEVHKPWGKEVWLELNESYCYKRIYINAGYKTSYQYHEKKRETNYIIEGTAEVWLENDEGVVEKKIMHAGDYFNVTPPKKHRVIALTDIILQEVSTPEVDDVIRIEDDANRKDGKIDGEHKTPAVLVLAAGLGTRLESLTKHANKALVPINNKAVISHIVEKFPVNYDIVVALGYKGDSIREYCNLAHPDRKFKFVEIEQYDGEGSGPGYSALQCSELLQRPFYLTTADCLIDSDMPFIDGNWIGVTPTSYPEKYSTAQVDEHDNVTNFLNKSDNGYAEAFIGLAGIWDYEVFWSELRLNMKSGEVVAAFSNPSKYPSLKAKRPKWLDTGNLDDLSKAKDHFNDRPLSLQKLNHEVVYRTNKFLKFDADTNVVANKAKRAAILKKVTPSNFKNTLHFISYDWIEGSTLYEKDSLALYTKFLTFLKSLITNSSRIVLDASVFDEFYVTKTEKRRTAFVDRFGERYYTEPYTINGVNYPPLKDVLSTVDLQQFHNNPTYDMFHGDLQFDNIIHSTDSDERFTYIDWRESFGGCVEGGDIYYDLAKLYGGCIIPYNLAKDDRFIRYTEGLSFVQFEHDTLPNLHKFKSVYEQWIVDAGFDLNKVKTLTAIIFLNMSPLHSDVFAKLLWFKSVQMLTDVNK